MLSVFVSYRRTDSPTHAGRLHDALAARFGDSNVFMDVDSIDPGVDYEKVIKSELARCDVLVAVIGPAWLQSEPEGESRLNDPHDLVRSEIASALNRNIRVVPVLVRGASLPTEGELPKELQPLIRRNAVTLSDEAWTLQVKELIARLEKPVVRPGPGPKPSPEPQPHPAPGPKSWSSRLRRLPPAVALAAVGALLLTGGLLAFVLWPDPGPPPDPDPTPTPTLASTPDPEVLRAIHVGGTPDGVAVAATGPESVWVVIGGDSDTDGTVVRIDPKTGKSATPVSRPQIGQLDSIAVGGGSVWVTGETSGKVARIDERSGRVSARISIDGGGQFKGLAIEERTVWVTDCGTGSVIRIQLSRGFPQTRFPLAGQPRSVVVDDGGRVYVAVRHEYPGCTPAPRGRGPSRIAVLDAGEQQFRTLVKVDDPNAVALTTDGALNKQWLWVADSPDELQHKVLRVDLETQEISGGVEVPRNLTSMAADGEGVWALSRSLDETIGTVARVEARGETLETVGEAIDVDGDPQEIAFGAGHVWVTQASLESVTPISP